MSSSAASFLALNREEALLTQFRDQLFGGSWGRFEFELRRLLETSGAETRDRDERILADLKLVDELRRRQMALHVNPETRGTRRRAMA